jgi:hypothetical protein
MRDVPVAIGDGRVKGVKPVRGDARVAIDDRIRKLEVRRPVGDHLANERTYLAWLRTALSISAFGIAINRFSLYPIGDWYQHARPARTGAAAQRRASPSCPSLPSRVPSSTPSFGAPASKRPSH